MARCITPITIKNKKTGYMEDVPCSKCWPCLQRKANAWAFRILEEKKRSTSANFVTLTYDDAHVPINPETMQLTLDKKEIPKYMKRLRKLHSKAYKLLPKEKLCEIQPLKYYAVGEYGEDFQRPHYHIILFNAIKELIPLAWSIDSKMLGMVDIGQKGVSAGGARYLCQYMLTGQDNDNPLRQRPFSLMSKNLGSNYLTDKMIKWHLQQTGKTIVTPDGKIIKTRDRYYAIQDGYKIALPRYYRDKIFPRIYREIDVPLITADATKKEDEKINKDWEGHHRNKAALILTNENIKQKKAKEKQRHSLTKELT